MARAIDNNNGIRLQNDNLETFALLWLDAAVNASEENRKAQQELRSSINHITTFEDLHRCQECILSTSKHDRVVLIVSGGLGQEVVPSIHDIPQVSFIYVYCMNKTKNERWAKTFSKVKAVTDRLEDLISCIKKDQKKRAQIENSTGFNIYSDQEHLGRSTAEVNGDFVHSLLVIDVLLRMKPVEKDKQELIKCCAEEYHDNIEELNHVHEFKEKYSPNQALYWYTRETFLYKILNKALRTKNIDLLFLFCFFIRDIHYQLKQNQYQSPVQVYRGQFLSRDELNKLRNSVGKFISNNSFFSTNMNRNQAEAFMYPSDISSDLRRILFEIDAHPRAVNSKPFADISLFSASSKESEFLFMIGCIFRLESIRRTDDDIWIVRLTLCSEKENDLIDLFNYMKGTYGGGEHEVDLNHFGKVLRRMGNFTLAEKFYRRLLHELPADDPSLSALYYSLGLVLLDKNDLDSSLKWLNKSLEIEMVKTPCNYKTIADRYNAIGNVYRKKEDLEKALSLYNEGLDVLKRNHVVDDLKKAHFYNNIALVYKTQKKI